MKTKPTLISVVGPTAVGKTALAIALAKYFNTEVLSADSRQFYREMEIGTAKPTAEEMGDVRHHFVNSHSIHKEYDAGQFAVDGLNVLKNLFKRKKVAILVGGSGLYVKAICDGLDEMPVVKEGVREELKQLQESEGLGKLLVELEETDPDFYQVVDRANPQRVIRALEVIRSSGKTYSSFRSRKARASSDFNVVKVGLEMDRVELYNRIDARMDLMIDAGLFHEAEQLYQYQHLNSLQTVGYREIFGYLNHEYDKEEAVRLLKRNSRRYAKRQLTWFKRDEDVHWFNPTNQQEIIAYVGSELT